MNPLSKSRLAAIVLSFGALSAIAGPHYTRMVESKPIVADGLEFIAVAEDDWFCFNPPNGQDPIQVQLYIRNTTTEPLIFRVFDTFAVSIRDKGGKELLHHGGRDGTLRTKPVLIEPGARYCLCRPADLRWNDDGKSRRFTYYDGTGSVAYTEPLVAGTYTLRFWCEYSNKDLPKPDATTPRTWTGKATTHEVTFKISDP